MIGSLPLRMKMALVAGGILLFAGILLVEVWASNSGPRLEGKKLVWWLQQASRGRPEAREKIRGQGAQSVPALLELMRRQDSTAKQWAVEAMWSFRFLPFDPPIPDAVCHSLSASGFEVLGAEGRSGVTGLTALLRQNHDTLRVATALCGIGEPALVPLQKALRSSSPLARENTMLALSMLKQGGEVFFPMVLERLSEDTNAIVRVRAAMVLGIKRVDRPEVVVGLTQALADTNAQVRSWAAWALGSYGNAAHEAIPAMLEMTRDPNPAVRRRAEAALKRLGPGLIAGKPVLIRED